MHSELQAFVHRNPGAQTWRAVLFFIRVFLGESSGIPLLWPALFLSPALWLLSSGPGASCPDFHWHPAEAAPAPLSLTRCPPARSARAQSAGRAQLPAAGWPSLPAPDPARASQAEGSLPGRRRACHALLLGPVPAFCWNVYLRALGPLGTLTGGCLPLNATAVSGKCLPSC